MTPPRCHLTHGWAVEGGAGQLSFGRACARSMIVAES